MFHVERLNLGHDIFVPRGTFSTTQSSQCPRSSVVKRSASTEIRTATWLPTLRVISSFRGCTAILHSFSSEKFPHHGTPPLLSRSARSNLLTAKLPGRAIRLT
jgi:hypothetical protein